MNSRFLIGFSLLLVLLGVAGSFSFGGSEFNVQQLPGEAEPQAPNQPDEAKSPPPLDQLQAAPLDEGGGLDGQSVLRQLGNRRHAVRLQADGGLQGRVSVIEPETLRLIPVSGATINFVQQGRTQLRVRTADDGVFVARGLVPSVVYDVFVFSRRSSSDGATFAAFSFVPIKGGERIGVEEKAPDVEDPDSVARGKSNSKPARQWVARLQDPPGGGGGMLDVTMSSLESFFSNLPGEYFDMFPFGGGGGGGDGSDSVGGGGGAGGGGGGGGGMPPLPFPFSSGDGGAGVLPQASPSRPSTTTSTPISP